MVEFFAEIGSNYITEEGGKSLYRAIRLIKEAAKAGCDGVKFQYFQADKLWNKDIFPKEHRRAELQELPLKWIPELKYRARKNGLLFGLSVFHPDSVGEVKEHVDYFKIASFEANWFELIEIAYKTHRRLMISTGQIDTMELSGIIKRLPAQDNRIDILHCVSKYPAKLKDCNFNLYKNYKVYNGWSDHTRDPVAIFCAIGAGLEVIEFHFDLADGEGLEADHSFYWGIVRNFIVLSKSIMGSGDWKEVAAQQDHKYKHNLKTGLRG